MNDNNDNNDNVPVDDLIFTKNNYYQILGIPVSSDSVAIKTAYKQKLLLNHPDKSARTNTEITLIQQAYKVLIDDQSRQKYDELLNKSVQKQGLIINGDGLDIYNLQDFIIIDDDYYKQCPRCRSDKSMKLTEDDLIEGTTDGTGDYEIIVQCNDCSLWIKVQYSEEMSE